MGLEVKEVRLDKIGVTLIVYNSNTGKLEEIYYPPHDSHYHIKIDIW